MTRLIEMSYVFREILAVRNARKLDADMVGQIIEALPKEDRAGALVKAARSARHYLHDSFDWNDKTAAEAHRLETARSIIRCIHWVSDTGEESPAFVSVRTGSSGGERMYLSTMEIGTSEMFQIRMMRAAKDDLLSFLDRYVMLTGVAPNVRALIEKLDRDIERAVARSIPPRR